MQRALSLTFDDGPDMPWTMRILDALERLGVRATFFMVGERVLRAPALARTVIAAGHEVELHCHHHLRHSELSESEIEHDTRAALAALEPLGVHPTYWRTPWGVQTAASARIAKEHRLRLVGWTIDTHDWRGDPAHTMLERARPALPDGGIALLHDALGPGARREGCENTIELLGGLVQAARCEGLAVGPLSLQRAEVSAFPKKQSTSPTLAVLGRGG